MTDTSDRSNEDLQDLRFAAGEGDAEEFFTHYRSTDAADSELGRELLWDALRNGDDDAKTAIVTRLLDDGADPTWIHRGNTVLHVLLAGNRHNAEVEAPLLAAMLERGADVNAVSPKDGTPLETIAARFKYTEADLKPYFDVILGRDDLDLLKTSVFGDTVLTNLRKWVDVRADLVARAEAYLTEHDE